MVLEPLQGWGLHHCPGQPGPMLDNHFSEEIFPDIPFEPPLTQLETISSWPFLLWKEEMGMAGRGGDGRRGWGEQEKVMAGRGGWQRDRITEPSRLEKTSEIIKSNRQPNPTTPAQPCPQGPHPHGFRTPPGMGTPPLPWAAWAKA